MKRMNITCCLFVILELLVVLTAVAAAGEESPLVSAKVGDWVEVKSTTEMPSGRNNVSMRRTTVIANDTTSVTVRKEITRDGQTMPPEESRIDLTKPYDPFAAPSGFTVEQVSQGDESIIVDGRSYATHWVSVKATMTSPVQQVESSARVWTSKDVPVYRMVKAESETTTTTAGIEGKTKTTQVITGFGWGK